MMSREAHHTLARDLRLPIISRMLGIHDLGFHLEGNVYNNAVYGARGGGGREEKEVLKK